MQCQKLKTYMETGRVVFLPARSIRPNPAQPRKIFRPEALDELRLPAEPEDRAVLRAVMELPEKYRLVVVLHCLEGYSFSEIAGLLQLTQSAVSMRLHRARKMLREQLGRDQ